MIQNGRKRQLETPQAVNNAIISICDILRRSNAAGAMQYVPELTWLLFLRILDEREMLEAQHAGSIGESFSRSLEKPYRWQDWAMKGGEIYETFSKGEWGKAKAFVETQLLPYLHGLGKRPGATSRQRMISEIMSSVNHTRIDTDTNLIEVLGKISEISEAAIDPTHVFPISQAYEGLLLRMGEKNSDGGQFFTPREIIRAVVAVIQPQTGETIYDPACGTGGFLAEAYEYILRTQHHKLSALEIDWLRHKAFYGREKEDLIYPIALANLILHGIDEPHIWHGNTLTGIASCDSLFHDAPNQFDVVLTNPPFGGKENKKTQNRFPFKTSATQVLFLQHIIDALKQGGRCGIVVDEGVLFRTNETAFVQTKRKLLNECDVWCIVSLPAGTFLGAGGSVKTNLVFFTKGKPTETIWYYDFSHIKVSKRNPLTLAAFEEFFQLLPKRANSSHSWTVNIVHRRIEAKQHAEAIRAQSVHPSARAAELKRRIEALKKLQQSDKIELESLYNEERALSRQIRELVQKAQTIEDAVFDLKAVNPNAAAPVSKLTTRQLLASIEEKGHKVAEALAQLRTWHRED